MRRHRMLIAAAVAAVVAAVGTGAAFATGVFTTSQTPQERQAAVLEDLAGRLGVTVDKLKTALKGVASDQIDQALADGKITQAEAKALKQRLESGDVPFGLGIGPGFGHGFGHHGDMIDGGALGVAADYLGLTEAQLRTQLEAGKSLADVAKAQGKSVDGLEQALLDEVSTKLDQALKDGRLTEAQKAKMLAAVKSRIADMVNGTMPMRGPDEMRGMHRWNGAGMPQMQRGGWYG